MNESSVAILGLGIIGSIWAGHYKAAGKLAATWSRSEKPDLPFEQTSLEACAAKAKVLQLCLYDAESVRSVLEQLAPFLTSEHRVVQSSTIDGASAKEFASMVRVTGAAYLEAPFTGSKPAAEQRKTVFFLGGDSDIVDELEPLLSTVSVKRFHIGTPHQACTIKLAMNLQIAGITQALCESITLSRRADISDDSFFEVMKENVSWSGLSALKEPKLRADDYSTQFSVKNLHKDMRLARESASQTLPLLEMVIDQLSATEESGLGEEDFIALLKSI